jgi:hypothetical protein
MKRLELDSLPLSPRLQITMGGGSSENCPARCAEKRYRGRDFRLIDGHETVVTGILS